MDPWLELFARANFLRSADTAHDLKTPLNVAVLNLELMRMRLRKVSEGAEDEKIASYAASIELELRRMARIFDAFFLLSTPPKNEGEPVLVDVAPILAEYELTIAAPARVRTHESRIRQAFKYLFDGAAKVIIAHTADVRRDDNLRITISGKPYTPDLEVTKIFKFYYTDADGNPELSLASSRLIVETYGGTLSAIQNDSAITIELSLPLVVE
jgi:signal transduction histidine kinase